jgi:tRNA (mo5U34)-methyltransferase
LTTAHVLREQVEQIDWYHRIELPGGVVTPGQRGPVGLSRLQLPESLSGKTVLDVGAWDGFYSFEAARRGAARVLATDSFVWQNRWTQAGFTLARSALELDAIVDDRIIDVMELSPDAVGETFDVVLCLGVLYHLVNPIEALTRVASMCRELLVLETETALNYLPFPAARCWPSDELARDETNWWSMNRRAITGVLRTCGFTDIRVVYHTPMWRRVARAALKSDDGFRAGLRSERVVIHARHDVGRSASPAIER